jgi:phosphate ABC transporter phosphate-binding protein
VNGQEDIMPIHARRRLPAALAAVFVVVLTATATATVQQPAFAASAHAQIEGSGSSWSANAVNQWVADVHQQGLSVVYTAPGSAQGRKDFSFSTVDYAVSDIAFQGQDPISHQADNSGGRAYAYLPIVAGGTAFPYQIKVGGKQVRDLRLSGDTLAKIFTNRITNWNDAQIAADNNGRQLPSLPIIPVVHSEGSGSSAQFTLYLAKQFQSSWQDYNSGSNTLNEYYPRKGDRMIAQNGSDGVMNFIASAAANGAIGYDEYSYALHANFPVAKLENAAHYFTLPTDKAVAKSLTLADINLDRNSQDYLTQKLDRVYVNPDDRTYPLSSYSYMILPIGAVDGRLTTQKRQTLVDFLYYGICTGQQEMGPLGYSPLPINLVQAGFDQVQKLKAADAAVDIARRDVSTCNNPTFVPGHPDQNYLAQIAPHPPACDKRGAGPCGATVGAAAGGAAAAGGPSAAASQSAAAQIDQDTGQVVGNNGGGNGDAGSGTGVLADNRSNGMTRVLGPLAVIELLAILVVPVVLNQRFARRRRRDGP